MEGDRKKTEEEREARKKYLDQAHDQAHGRDDRRREQTQEEREGRHRQREETLAVKDKEKEVDAIKVRKGEEGYGRPSWDGMGKREAIKVWGVSRK